MSKLRSHLACLIDPATPDEKKLKAAQEVSENLETIVSSQHYPNFLETAIPIFLQLLKEGDPLFASDNQIQQLRKLVLELIHRLPANDSLKSHVKSMLLAMFALVEVENEENVLVCLRVIIELHKHFKPPFAEEISRFLQFVKKIYADLPNTMVTLFEPGGAGSSDDGGTKSSSSVLPKAATSLKVLAELPIIVVVIYQLYKATVESAVLEFIPLTVNTILLQPSLKAKQDPAFNKEVYVDFVAVQIKFLSFLAYIIRIFQDQVNQYAPNVVQGMLSLLKNCPHEVAHLRRDLLVAARYILGTELRVRFIPYIDQLFNEDIFIGTGWTTRDAVRSMAYSILVDVVHHIRGQLSLPHLSLAVQLFSKNVHDASLSLTIQNISCKLLLNLMEAIRVKAEQEPSARDLLMQMMEVFILKFQFIAEYQIPELFGRCSNPSADGASPSSDRILSPPGNSSGDPSKKLTSPTPSNGLLVSLSQPFPLTVADCRGLVKTLVCGMKTIMWGVGACKVAGGAATAGAPGGVDFTAKSTRVNQEHFFPHETEQFMRLFRYGVVALDIYRITVLPNSSHVLRNANCQTVKTKEEKEVLEHFAGVFTMMGMTMYKEVFSDLIGYLVERIQTNYALQLIPNSFLSNSTTSATFASILLTFLLKRMDTMGDNMEQSNLYLKLFKLVFGSVTLFAQENELMLKPHLHEIVNKSMSLANTAQEPCNYFLLLRALFRSIGGGSHEQLYQEFLPLLSNLLQGLNRLQSGHHRQYMKDLFVELCLTVPVRLSSLLPYLHMLMDPLVSALNGSQTLINQGLRTLELCVDNLQPDFLYDHIQPVRAELMQALWCTLHNPDDAVATVAFRVLGKFGGSNRKMLSSPQPLKYRETLQPGAALKIRFPHTEGGFIDLQVGPIIEVAVKLLRPSPTSQNVESFYRQQAWHIIQSFLVGMLSLGDSELDLYQLLRQVNYQPSDVHSGRLKHISLPQCTNKEARASFETALCGVFVCSCLRDIRSEALVFMAGIVKHITTLAVVQQCSSSNLLKQPAQDVMDVYVLLDAIVRCISSEEKELCKIGELALNMMIETSVTIVGNRGKAADLPLFEVMADKLCGSCYERAWFAKSGGCSAISFLMDKMPLKFIIMHQLSFVMALLYVLLDLINQVSSGTVAIAKKNLRKLLELCNSPLREEDKKAVGTLQEKSFHMVSRHLVKEVISPNENVRKESHSSLELLASVTGKSVTAIMEPHREILADMIPPKKHLLKHQPISTQIALMDGNTFCTSLSPRLFSINLSIPEHQTFFQELLTLCESDKAALSKLPCYRMVHSLVPLKVSGLAALAACHYLVEVREKIFTVLYKTINSHQSVKELQEAGKEAMKKFMVEHSQADIELVHAALRPLLMTLGDYRNLTPPLLVRLTYMIELFPTSFNEKMCNSLMAHLRNWIEVLQNTAAANATATNVGVVDRNRDEVTVCLHIMTMLHMLPASTFRLFEPLLALSLKGEKALGIEMSPFREPVLKFALKFPSQTIDFFLCRLFDVSLSHLFTYMLRKQEGNPLRESLAASPHKIISTTFSLCAQISTNSEVPAHKRQELQFQGICLCHLLVEKDSAWIKGKTAIVECLKKVWLTEDYSFRMAKDFQYWSECPKLLQCLLSHCQHNPDDVLTLFQLLRVYLQRLISSFHFLTTYLENDVARGYSIDQKRNVFFRFVDVYSRSDYPQELKAKILQYILIPMFKATFEEEKGDLLLGGAPDPEHDSNENIISVFINKVIDPDKPFGSTDSVCILLLQFSSLLVEHAAPHIHDSNNKRQGAKLRRLMTFAWPCLLPKQCVDPATKYHGHLLLAHIIAKFAIHKRIVLQVFHSLLKAHAVDARSIVRQALNILTPVVPVRMEDTNATLVHWTKKIIVEEGHSVAQLVHMLQLLCRHHRVYYPVRQHLVQHMVTSIQRLGLPLSATIEQRKLAVDLAEVIIKWEFQRVNELQESEVEPMEQGGVALSSSAQKDIPGSSSAGAAPQVLGLGMKRTPSDTSMAAGELKRQRAQAQVADPLWALEKQHVDSIINFLIRLSCQVMDTTSLPGSPALASSPSPSVSPGEALSKRCVSIVKTALKPEIWPSIDIKLLWFAKVLEPIGILDPPTDALMANHPNICTALDLLSFLLQVLPQQVVLNGFRLLHKGVGMCMTCGNTKVVRYVHGLITRLVTMFPPDLVPTEHEELEPLYSHMVKVITDGLVSFEKNSSLNLSGLQCTLMVLKAACTNNNSYMDGFLALVSKVIQKLHKEHISTLSTSSQDTQTISELLQWCMDLCKSCVHTMLTDVRKAFMNVLTNLIEKSPDPKLLKTLTKIVDEWIRGKPDQQVHLGPTLREKTLLLSRMMIFYEKRFPDETELLTQFLDIVLYVYKNDQLSNTELTTKLEPSFLCGLRCSHVPTRRQFYEVYKSSIHNKLLERLLYIVCSQNWEHCGHFFWLKHCIELVLSVADLEAPVQASNGTPRFPSILVVGPAHTPQAHDVTEPPAISSQLPDELMEVTDSDRADGSGGGGLDKLTSKLTGFISDAKNVKTSQFVLSVSALCHVDTDLAHWTWLELFPKLWRILSETQRAALSSELSPFMCSGAHLSQMDSHPSAVGAFLEGVVRCQPQPHIRSCVLKYLGKTHNFWYGSALILEQRAYAEGELPAKSKDPPDYSGKYTDQILDPLKHETLDSLSELYATLNEQDLWAGLWIERCRFPETSIGIVYESQGLFEAAQESYEDAIQRAREYHNTCSVPPSILPEYKLWEEHWCRCARELGQWEMLNDFGKSQNGMNPFLVLENAWRVQDWTAMKDASTQAEPICSENYSARLNLLRGFLALCYPDEQRLSAVEKLIEAASIQGVKQWRRLPAIVAHSHISLLQLSQQIMELQEATTIHSGLQSGGLNRQPFQNEVTTIFKTWKNRLPNCSDDLSHWSDVFSWRQVHYKHLIKAYEALPITENNQSMRIVHHLASSIINFASVARKHRLHQVCLVSLSKIHSIPSVPVLDCFQKIKEQVKCYLQMSGLMEEAELQEAMEVVESTNLMFFTKEMISKFMALKGSLLTQTGKEKEGNESFSAAVQLQDGLVKGWALWGEYLQSLFELDGNMTLAHSVLTCYIHACRTQKEAKCRKYLAHIVWMLTYDDAKGSLAEVLDKYYNGIAPNHWLPWIPQLLTCLVRQEGGYILNLLCSVGKEFPQAVYFPIRTLYLTLKMEQREKFKADQSRSSATPTSSSTRPHEPSETTTPDHTPSETTPSQEELKSLGGPSGATKSSTSSTSGVESLPTVSGGLGATGSGTASTGGGTSGEPAPIRAPASLWRCSRIMHLLRDLRPTLLSALEGIVDQMIWFRENWYEELLRQLNEGLVLCQTAAFEKRQDIANARISPEMMGFVRKLVNTFGIGLEQTSGSNSGSTMGPISHEALAKRAQAAAQDPAFQRLKAQFASDFDFTLPAAQRVHNLMAKMKKWIKILELKTKSLQKSFLLEDRCRFLSNFSLATAEVELPGEYLVPKPMPYYVRIARFMPRVEIVQKHNSTVRRLYIQGHNGKIYPYLVLNDNQVARCRSEERVLQLLNLINLFLSKDKECCRRNLQFVVPRVVSVSPQMRLVEDHTSNVSLTDIFKQHCSTHGLDWDCTILQYYERLAQLQARGETITHSTLQTIFSQIQSSIAPQSMLTHWAQQIYQSGTQYWTFRKQVTLQLALSGLAEFVFHLSRLDPDMFQIACSNGQLTQTFHIFHINKQGSLDANRPVPFRLTPPLQAFITQIGITGPLQLSMLAAARCFTQPLHGLESVLRAILRDEYIAWKKRDMEEETNSLLSTGDVNNADVIKLVDEAITSVFARLHNLADMEDGTSKVTLLVTEAANIENICRMDPAWNPWM